MSLLNIMNSTCSKSARFFMLPTAPENCGNAIKVQSRIVKTVHVDISAQDSTRPGDKCRRFIISYRLSDDTINIYEPPIRNSGVVGGKFLEPTRVSKPNSPLDQPEYYGPQDFYIGAVVEIFKHRFVIINADYYVLKYLEKHCHQMSGMICFAILLNSF